MKVVKYGNKANDAAKVNSTSKSAGKRNVKPFIMAGLAAAMIATPLAGLGISNVISGAAEVEPQDEQTVESMNLTADFVEPATDVIEDVKQIAKKVKFNVPDGAHVTAGDNASFDAETSVLTFADNDKDAKFSVSVDDGHKLDSVQFDGIKMTSDDGSYTLFKDEETVLVTVAISDAPTAEEQKAAEEAARQQAEQEAAEKAAAEEAARQQAAAQSSASKKSASAGSSASSESTSSSASSSEKSSGSAKNSTSTKKTTSKQSTSTKKSSGSSSSTAAVIGVAKHSMTSEELSMAKDIFNAYNDWRTSHGLAAATWDENCANMAYGSAKGCGQRGSLIHRLGIPSKYQSSYSDILQYATYRMSGKEALTNWANSSGHLAQLRCKGTGKAAVGVYKSGGTYWFAVVYTFSGTNIG